MTAHIPLGIASPEGTLSMYEMFHTALVIILQTYADIIVGMHFGHDHTDSSNADGKILCTCVSFTYIEDLT